VTPHLQIALDADPPRYRPGDPVRGHVSVVEGGRSRELRVALRYCEATSDSFAVAAEIPGGSLHKGELATGTRFPFEVALESDALPSYESANGSLYWEVEATADVVGPDEKARLRFTVDAAPHEGGQPRPGP
jgi:hypothetical protein